MSPPDQTEPTIGEHAWSRYQYGSVSMLGIGSKLTLLDIFNLWTTSASNQTHILFKILTTEITRMMVVYHLRDTRYQIFYHNSDTEEPDERISKEF